AELALEMRDAVARLGERKGLPLRMRFGMHTGRVVAGVIGTRKFSYDLWSETVNLASRMEAHGLADCIQVTPATYERLRDRYVFEERGPIEVKGCGQMVTYLLKERRGDVTGASPAGEEG